MSFGSKSNEAPAKTTKVQRSILKGKASKLKNDTFIVSTTKIKEETKPEVAEPSTCDFFATLINHKASTKKRIVHDDVDVNPGNNLHFESLVNVVMANDSQSEKEDSKADDDKVHDSRTTILGISVRFQESKEHDVPLISVTKERVVTHLSEQGNTMSLSVQKSNISEKMRRNKLKWVKKNVPEVNYDDSQWVASKVNEMVSDDQEDRFDQADEYALFSRDYIKSRKVRSRRTKHKETPNTQILLFKDLSIEIDESSSIETHSKRFEDIEKLLCNIEDFSYSEARFLWNALLRQVLGRFHKEVDLDRFLERYLSYSKRRSNAWHHNFDDELPFKRRACARFLLDMELKLARIESFEKICGKMFSVDIKYLVLDFAYGKVMDYLRTMPESLFECCRFFNFPNQIESSFSLLSEFRKFSLSNIVSKMNSVLLVPEYEVIKSLFLFFEHPALQLYLGEWWFPSIDVTSCLIEIKLYQDINESTAFALKNSETPLALKLSLINVKELPNWITLEFDHFLKFEFLESLIRTCFLSYYLSLSKPLSQLGKSQLLRGAFSVLFETLVHLVVFIVNLKNDDSYSEKEFYRSVNARSHVIASLISSLSFFAVQDLHKIHWNFCMSNEFVDPLSLSPIKNLLELLELIFEKKIMPAQLSKIIVHKRMILSMVADKFKESLDRAKFLMNELSRDDPFYKIRGKYFEICLLNDQEKNLDHRNKCCPWWAATGLCAGIGKTCKLLHPLWANNVIPRYCVSYLNFASCENPTCKHLHSCFVSLQEDSLRKRAEESAQDSPHSAIAHRILFCKLWRSYVELDFSTLTELLPARKF
jgi:hypothetical protein